MIEIFSFVLFLKVNIQVLNSIPGAVKRRLQPMVGLSHLKNTPSSIRHPFLGLPHQ